MNLFRNFKNYSAVLFFLGWISFCGKKEIAMPEFFSSDLPTLQGNHLKLAKYNPLPVALVFWSTECRECVEDNLSILRMLESSSVKFNIVSVNTDKKEKSEFAKKESEKFHILTDSVHDADLKLVQEVQLERQPGLVLFIPGKKDYRVIKFYDFSREDIARHIDAIEEAKKEAMK